MLWGLLAVSQCVGGRLWQRLFSPENKESGSIRGRQATFKLENHAVHTHAQTDRHQSHEPRICCTKQESFKGPFWLCFVSSQRDLCDLQTDDNDKSFVYWSAPPCVPISQNFSCLSPLYTLKSCSSSTNLSPPSAFSISFQIILTHLTPGLFFFFCCCLPFFNRPEQMFIPLSPGCPLRKGIVKAATTERNSEKVAVSEKEIKTLMSSEESQDLSFCSSSYFLNALLIKFILIMREEHSYKRKKIELIGELCKGTQSYVQKGV